MSGGRSRVIKRVIFILMMGCYLIGWVMMESVMLVKIVGLVMSCWVRMSCVLFGLVKVL